jgi:hypothetical protein
VRDRGFEVESMVRVGALEAYGRAWVVEEEEEGGVGEMWVAKKLLSSIAQYLNSIHIDTMNPLSKFRVWEKENTKEVIFGAGTLGCIYRYIQA